MASQQQYTESLLKMKTMWWRVSREEGGDWKARKGGVGEEREREEKENRVRVLICALIPC